MPIMAITDPFSTSLIVNRLLVYVYAAGCQDMAIIAISIDIRHPHQPVPAWPEGRPEQGVTDNNGQ